VRASVFFRPKMLVALIVLQWLHVFTAIFWFGSVLFVDFILIPTVQGLDGPVRGAVMGPLGHRIEKFLTPIGMAVVTLGLLRGIAGGAFGGLGMAYEVTFIASLVLGIVIVVYGLRLLRPLAQAVGRTPPGPEQDALVARLKTLTIAELGMFLVIITLMILMRFGY